MKKLLLLGWLLLWMLLSVSCNQTDSAPPDQTAADTALTDIPLHGQSYLYRIEEGDFSAYVGGKVIADEKVGEKITDVTIRAGWQDLSDQTPLSEEKLRGEVYAIRDISADIAVALKFLDVGDAVTTTHYYVIVNPEADLTSVAEYVIAHRLP